MKRIGQFRRSWVVVVGALTVAVCLPVMAQNDARAKPEIAITVIPPAGAGGPDRTERIAGTVKAVDFRAHRVVVYAFAGNQWYVQPTAASPKTPICTKGDWETDTHLGRQYAALLVTSAFRPKSVTAELPDVGADVLAVDTVAAKGR